METLYDHRVLRRHAISERFCSVSGGDSGSVEKILCAPRDAMQRPAVFACSDLLIGLFGLRERQLARERDDAVQLLIELLQTLQVNAGEPPRSKLSLLDPARQLCHRREGNVLVARGQGARIALAADKAVVLGASLVAGQHRV